MFATKKPIPFRAVATRAASHKIGQVITTTMTSRNYMIH